ncbi:hypothetical protein, partial [Neisseria weixii]|uniref:hypothetical protein n=1 Tax=Neisseria weixii TaxID=1853276 RepID=UPI0035A1056E
QPKSNTIPCQNHQPAVLQSDLILTKLQKSQSGLTAQVEKTQIDLNVWFKSIRYDGKCWVGQKISVSRQRGNAEQHFAF